MSGENCLGSSRNFRNYPKTRYSMDFGVGPIEHICVCVCVCLFVCGTWTSYENQKIYMASSH
jgi:hypothetical protein